MKPIQILLDELNKRISTTTSQINDLKECKTAVLSIENILFKYDITNYEISIEKLITFSDNDLSNIFEEMDYKDTSIITEQFSKNKEILKLYENIIANHGNLSEAPQYNQAMESLNNILLEVTNYLIKHKKEQLEHISSLEKVLHSYTSIYNKFKSEDLKEPIFDMKEFHDMLNKCGLDLTTKCSIKIAVGKLNYNLVVNKGFSKCGKDNSLDKYRIILKSKQKEYAVEILNIEEYILEKQLVITMNNILTIIDDLYTEMNFPYKVIQNVLVCYMLEKKISTYDEQISKNYQIKSETKEKAIFDCEKLLIISRKHAPKPLIKDKKSQKSLEKKDKKVVENDDLLISEIQMIVSDEKDFLKTFSLNDTTRLTEISVIYENFINNEDSLEKEWHTLAFISETLRLNLIFFEQLVKNYKDSPREYESDYKKMVVELIDYISTYKIVKKRIKEYADFAQDNNSNKNK